MNTGTQPATPVSYEFFPPKTPEGAVKLRGVRQALYAVVATIITRHTTLVTSPPSSL